jgi:rod shape-determining protein MreB
LVAIDLMMYVCRNYGILIDKTITKHIKHKIGCAFPMRDLFEIEVRGKNLTEGIILHSLPLKY